MHIAEYLYGSCLILCMLDLHKLIKAINSLLLSQLTLMPEPRYSLENKHANRPVRSLLYST